MEVEQHPEIGDGARRAGEDTGLTPFPSAGLPGSGGLMGLATFDMPGHPLHGKDAAGRSSLFERLPAALVEQMRARLEDAAEVHPEILLYDIGHMVADELERRDLVLKPFLSNVAYSTMRLQEILKSREPK